MIGLAIPMLNEEGNVELVLNEICTVLSQESYSYRIAAVNNGSSDETGRIISDLARKNKNIIPIHLETNQGYGGGILQGMKELEKSEPTVLGWMWGDGQISPQILPKLYESCTAGADIAKATRVLRHDGRKRKLISSTYARTMKWMGIETKDVNGCPKLFSLSAWRELELDAMDWFLDAQAILKAKSEGMYIAHHPVTMKKRIHGKSKVNWGTVAEFSLNMFKWKWISK